MILVVLSGGSGSQLWPLPRKQYPKQLLALTGDDTLFQQTIKHLAFDDMQAPLLTCNKEHRFIIQEQLEAQNLANQAILLEPFGHNTAPAVAIVVVKLVAEGRDELLLILPASHVVKDQHAFRQALALAINATEKGEVVLFGTPASHPETGYGYIRASTGTQLPEDASRVQSFVERPDEARARELVAAGDYYWNSGVFLFRASHYLEELKKHDASIYDTCLLTLEHSQHDGDPVDIDAATFECCPDNSIDCTVMEKASRACVAPLSAGWNDVGSWPSIQGVHAKDTNGNVTKGDVLVHDSHNCLVHGSGRLVSVIGSEDIAVVGTKDAMMIAHKGRVQDVEHIVRDLDAQGRSEIQNHCEVYRPWDSYDSVGMGDRFQIKHITMKPDTRLSLQMHRRRAEHWIVASGTAQVTCDDKTFPLTESQSTYILIVSMHRLANPDKIPLEIIKVQSGNHLGEDDIERLEDVYGRTVEPTLQVVAGNR